MVSEKDRKAFDARVNRVTGFMVLHPKTSLVLFLATVVVAFVLGLQF